MKRVVAVAVVSVLSLAFSASLSLAEKVEKKVEKKAEEKSAESKGGEKVAPALSFTMDSLEGKPVKLSKYAGKVVLIVNVASQCGLTPQYEGLEELHGKYKGKGLAILGFPANEFGKQEPGSNKEIAEFCAKNYGVEFDMFSKVVVKGDGKCELYQFLTSKEKNGKFGGEITWNFEKFLLNKNGEVVNRFAPGVKPDAPEVIKAIEAELAK
ncbi:MAG: Glutathione peroxidase [Planctomycetaceae bacterium]|nr:Glutathione peroxidase [Planctomycetaceae bacterium]